jgi:hypothetical protein
LAAPDQLRFGHCAALTVDTLQRPKSFDAGRAQHGQRLFEALGHDMVQVWSPTVDNYLGRVCKERFLEAVREGVQLGKFAFSDAKRLFDSIGQTWKSSG